MALTEPFRSSFPCAESLIAAAAVNCLVRDPIRNTVRCGGGAGLRFAKTKATIELARRRLSIQPRPCRIGVLADHIRGDFIDARDGTWFARVWQPGESACAHRKDPGPGWHDAKQGGRSCDDSSLASLHHGPRHLFQYRALAGAVPDLGRVHAKRVLLRKRCPHQSGSVFGAGSAAKHSCRKKCTWPELPAGFNKKWLAAELPRVLRKKGWQPSRYPQFFFAQKVVGSRLPRFLRKREWRRATRRVLHNMKCPGSASPAPLLRSLDCGSASAADPSTFARWRLAALSFRCKKARKSIWQRCAKRPRSGCLNCWSRCRACCRDQSLPPQVRSSLGPPM